MLLSFVRTCQWQSNFFLRKWFLTDHFVKVNHSTWGKIDVQLEISTFFPFIRMIKDPSSEIISELPHVCWLQVKFHQKAVMSEHWRNSNSLTCLSTCVPLSQNYNNQDFGDLASVVLIISFYILFLVSAWNTGNFRLQLMLFYHDKFVEWYEWNHQFVWMYWYLPFFIFFWISENVLSCYW